MKGTLEQGSECQQPEKEGKTQAIVDGGGETQVIANVRRKVNAGRKAFDGLLWGLTVIFGTITGVLGSYLAALVTMSNYVTMWQIEFENGGDTTHREAAKSWMENNAWIVNFVQEKVPNDQFSEKLLWFSGSAILFLACIIGLMVLSGRFHRESTGEIHLNWFDRIWSEVILAVGIGAGTAAVGLAFPMYEIWPHINVPNVYTSRFPDNYVFGMKNETVWILAGVGMALSILLTVLCAVSLVKKMKAHKLWGNSIAGIIFGYIKKVVNGGIGAIKASDESVKKYVLILLGMTILAMTWVGALIDLGLILYFVPKKVKKFAEISKGAMEVKSGDLNYKIPVEFREKDGKKMPASQWDQLACDINEISQASNLAVQNELKNQRLKTDLISNVSHDLKTPLTSMISYLDLLKKEGLTSEHAEEYLQIVDEKTQRLKLLTENLFEAAKASSGNIPCQIEKIDLSMVVAQALAEMEHRLQDKNLQVITKNQLEYDSVMADGQLLWRVVENLLSNISKYALPRSRVYLNLYQTKGSNRLEGKFQAGELGELSGVVPARNGFTVLEVKNISENPLNISAEELMERFQRGDESRSTEGSGLGLAIAKDLIKLMGGVFEISVDGDLFKAVVMLPTA